MSNSTNTEVATEFQATSCRKPPISVIVTIDQPYCRMSSNWQAARIKPVKAGGVIISSIAGVTNLVLSRFLRLQIEGYIGNRFGKYQLNFIKCEEVPVEYKNPILTILARAGVPKIRGEIMQSDLGANFAQKIAADPSHINRLFPRIKEPGAKAIFTACKKTVAGSVIFQALNSVSAPQKAIDAASAFDLETQSIFSMIDRGAPFACVNRVTALARMFA